MSSAIEDRRLSLRDALRRLNGALALLDEIEITLEDPDSLKAARVELTNLRNQYRNELADLAKW